jgi:hypothetical protein
VESLARIDEDDPSSGYHAERAAYPPRIGEGRRDLIRKTRLLEQWSRGQGWGGGGGVSSCHTMHRRLYTSGRPPPLSHLSTVHDTVWWCTGCNDKLLHAYSSRASISTCTVQLSLSRLLIRSETIITDGNLNPTRRYQWLLDLF